MYKKDTYIVRNGRPRVEIESPIADSVDISISDS